MSLIDDGYLIGALAPTQKKCKRCGKVTRCIDIAKITLPHGFTVQATILWDKEQGAALPSIGLGCGDYARFHRQIVWILTSQGLRSGQAT